MSTAIDLAPFLEMLRNARNKNTTITVAVVSRSDYEALLFHSAGSLAAYIAIGQPDSSVALATRENPTLLDGLLSNEGVMPESWIKLHAYGDLPEAAVYVGNIGGRYVRLQTGLLDGPLGYVAVQSSQRSDLPDVLGMFYRWATSPFDLIFDRLATAPARVGQPPM